MNKNPALKWVEDHAEEILFGYANGSTAARSVLRANAQYMAYPNDDGARKALETAIEQYQAVKGVQS